ncbi:MAG: hypothetical protein ABIH66_08965 [bacterium]
MKPRGFLIFSALLIFSSTCFARSAAGEGLDRMRAVDLDLLRRCAPRPAGMGGAFTAVKDDPIGLFWNPAAALHANRLMISGNHSLRHFPGERENLDQFDSDTTAIIVPLEGETAMGVGFTVPGEWGIDHVDTNGVVPGAERLRGRERMLAFGDVGGGRRAAAGTAHSDWLRYGGPGGDSVRSFGRGAGFSFFYEGDDGFTYGVSLKGLASLIRGGGGDGKAGEATIGLGVAYRAHDVARTLAALDLEIRFRAARRTRVLVFGGVERRFENRAFARLGCMHGLPTYGVGVKSGGLRLDYAVVKDLLPRVVDKDVAAFRDGHFLSYTLGM